MINTNNNPSEVQSIEAISSRVLSIRGQKVLIDADLAALYGVETKVLLQAVKRNFERFPDDFMFQLNSEEWDVLRSQFVTSNKGRGGRRYAPYAFTEQGVAMLSSVLNSYQAIQVNIAIMRAFVKLREILATNKDLASQFEELARKVDSHDQAITGLIHTLRDLMSPKNPPVSRPIGFVQLKDKSK
ncbi:MAG: ORF6N domain-containing protein [Methylococcales bacterium]|nr:ORF6N domain-containing protein [Methylotenera sp.]